MNYGAAAGLFIGVLFLGMLVLLEAGWRLGRQHRAREGEAARAGLGVVEGAVFGLLGLLVAFTFSGAAARFDARRHLVVEEANDIGTAYLRLDLLPAAAQPALREKFRQYVDARLGVYRALPDLEAARNELARATALQGEIWNQAIAAGRDATPQAMMLLLPALNAMIDITTTRTQATKMHLPVIIMVLLAVVALACSLLAGYGMAGAAERSWIHVFGFAAILAVTVYVIVDLEYPRLGLIRVDTADQVLIDLRAGMQ